MLENNNFNCIFVKETYLILIQILLRFVPKGPVGK